MKILRICLKGIICALALYGSFMLFSLGKRLVKAVTTSYAEQTVGASEVLPVVIIGSGPAGLVAAQPLLEDGIPVVILEGKQAGGPINTLTPVSNWPGRGFTSGNLIVADLRAEIEADKKARFIARSVDSVGLSGDTHVLHLDNGELLKTQTVIIAMGTHPRYLTLPGAKEYAQAISYEQTPTDREKKGKCVVIGGGIDAIRKAVYRLRAGCEVTLLIRGNRMPAGIGIRRKELIDDYLKTGKLTILYQTEAVELLGDKRTGTLTGIRLSNGTTLPADHIAVAIGREPNSQLFGSQLKLNEDGSIALQGHTQATSRPGVFAAGDITGVNYSECMIAAGDGMKAGKDVLQYLDTLLN